MMGIYGYKTKKDLKTRGIGRRPDFIEFSGQRVDVGAVVEKGRALVSDDRDEYDFLGA